ncbi:MAG: diaminopimelate dehydrogenase [Clostridia bacterium]|nr:diaminopimelate dehydrogenase [Clostridia bacterium]
MKVAIYGYGNLGRGVESAVLRSNDMELVGVFTRRAPESVKTVSGVKSYHASELVAFADKIDVLILCGGSATDLPLMTPELAGKFNVIDSFDTHAKIPEHFDRVDARARETSHTALISCGWDPGLFSLMRVFFETALPDGNTYTFWGRGISQGHSDAIRRIEGVRNARQYTVPVPEAIGAVRGGETPELTTRQKHLRECYVVAEEGADRERITREIVSMPNYFADYDTSVTFISEEELLREHGGMPHGGSVIRNGTTGFSSENSHNIEFSLKLDSNPEFTGSVLVAYARAVQRLSERGEYGCKTVFDIAPRDLSPKSAEELRRTLL